MILIRMNKVELLTYYQQYGVDVQSADGLYTQITAEKGSEVSNENIARS